MFHLSISPPPLRVLRDYGCSLFGTRSSSGARSSRGFLQSQTRHRDARERFLLFINPHALVRAIDALWPQGPNVRNPQARPFNPSG
ncbi:hypothetical protein NDU88_004223 [Pleurodeles waltl]|uniref:Uncharacterized protein n=1 Tax=Pleurodeles waltl TaxID=8319 RepID=A0AAV7M7S3_PLEWA|nr:hypothetical protein NDU88_004223 [Pleurodeles waltl]